MLGMEVSQPQMDKQPHDGIELPRSGEAQSTREGELGCGQHQREDELGSLASTREDELGTGQHQRGRVGPWPAPERTSWAVASTRERQKRRESEGPDSEPYRWQGCAGGGDSGKEEHSSH